MGTPALSIVVVNFKTARHLVRLFEALDSARGALAVELILVDSSSPDREEARAALERARFPVVWLPLDENRGFGAAANAGAARASAPRILFANPDAIPPERSIEALARALDDREGAGAVAPRLVSERGQHETGDAGDLPSVAAALAYALGLPRVFAGAPRLFLVLERDGEARRVGWLSGAFLLVRADAFRAASGFDESFFLFGEDVDLGRRLAAIGRERLYVPAVAVVHEGGASYRTRGRSLAPLEGRWAAGLARAHARSGAGVVARAAFALLLALGLSVRAFASFVGVGPRAQQGARERRSHARRLLRAARLVLSG